MRNIKPVYLIAALLIIAYVAAQYYKPRAVDWSSTLYNHKKAPFDTYILYHRIGDLFPGSAVQTSREPVYNTLERKRPGKVTYIIICNTTNVDRTDYKKLESFVRAGNDVFIATNSLAYMEQKLKIKADYEGNMQRPARVSFSRPDLAKENFSFEREITNGYYQDLDSNRFEPLGVNEKGHANFVRLRMGKGSLFLHANPLMFSNYALLEKGGARYASLALSHLDVNKHVIWDEFYTRGRGGSESEMRFFLAHPSLRWAVYIAFFGLILFVLYQVKRRQAAIPVISPPDNNSVEFARVVGQVYYEHRDNSNIALKKVAYFLEHIRTKYHMRTHVLNDEFVVLLAKKAGAEKKLLQELCHQIILIRNGHEVADAELMALNEKMEQFYKQTR
ncbi:MAG: DUF4350 domain-containing protein [Arcticibacter sp.]